MSPCTPDTDRTVGMDFAGAKGALHRQIKEADDRRSGWYFSCHECGNSSLRYNDFADAMHSGIKHLEAHAK